MAVIEPVGCRIQERLRERNRVGVWGFGNVSRDVVLFLVTEELGKEVIFYGRPKGEFTDRAGAWIEDLKANAIQRPRIMGTNQVEDMAGLDVIFIGVGVPRRPGMTRDDLLAVNVKAIADTALTIHRLYEGCGRGDLPILIFMGNPVAIMTWVGYKASGFPKQNILGQAGNLDSRRICHALSKELGLSGRDLRGMVFGDHGDSMVAGPRYFTVGGVSLEDVIRAESLDRAKIQGIMDEAKKGGTHFVLATGQSASAGPAHAACEMMRPMIRGEYEVQPVVAILEKEYGLLKPEDGLSTMSFGVPARIGPEGVSKIYEVDVEEIRPQLEQSAGLIKEGIQDAAKLLKDNYRIE